ncbi:YuzB family protein [Niallia sp. Krafla_26]|uniref:YuzB family protein n=1 Tax=Niallia sp. Krafla_26 TaxID=3064703 RepID=UPI003D18021B
MRRTLIEFCITNLANGAQKARAELERDSNLDVVEYGCLSQCGKCHHTLYALVNGEVVMGENSEQLVENIYDYIDRLPL